MIDVKLLRSDPETLRETLRKKHEGRADLDAALQADTERRKILVEVETLQKERNDGSREVARRKQSGEAAEELTLRLREVGERIAALEASLRGKDAELEVLLQWFPNAPESDVPEGADASANLEVARWGEPTTLAFPALSHDEIVQRQGWIDMIGGARLAGSSFPLYTGMGARLLRALIQFMLDLHTREHGYTEISPPTLARREIMFGTGQLPKLEEDMYRLEKDDLFLLPTAEVALANLHRDEILDLADLPKAYVAHTSCFRREAGAAGKQTRGILRVHQFDKVELVRFERPERGREALEEMRRHAEEVLRRLEIPYRVLLLSTGDMSFASAMTYDIEAWAPASAAWLEVSSCSTCSDFQARRMGTRFRDERRKVRLLHTLNGSGLALPRTYIALIERHQQADGRVRIPAALQPYMDGREVL